MSIRVLIAEDQMMVRGALCALLSLEEELLRHGDKVLVAQASRSDPAEDAPEGRA